MSNGDRAENDGVTEDGELLRRYSEDGSQEAFEELVRRHINLVYFTALRLVGGNAHLADDVSQRVFNDLARKAATLKDRAVLAGWLYTGARYAASQAVRSERRRRTHEQEGHEMNELNSAPESGWDQLRPIIDETMESLNERDREVVLLRFFEGRPLAEIGAKLRLSPDAARMRIDRALEKLRGQLARRGIASTSAALAAAFVSQSAMAAPAGLVAKVAVGALSQAGVATATTFGLWKILTGVLVGGVGIGVAVHEVEKVSRPGAALVPLGQAGDAQVSPVSEPAPPLSVGAPSAMGSGAMPAENVRAPGGTAGTQGTTDDFGWPQVGLFAGDANTRPSHTVAEFKAKMLEDDVFRQTVFRQAKARLDLFYGRLFASLNLPAPQLDRFRNLLVEKEATNFDVLEAQRELGFAANRDRLVLREGRDRGQQDVDNDIKALLGDGPYADYVQYRYDLIQWTAVNRLTLALRDTPTPLTDEQAGKLAVLLRDSLLRIKSPFTFDIAIGAGLFSANIGSALTQRVYERAGEFLSAPQVDALRSLQRQDRARSQ